LLEEGSNVTAAVNDRNYRHALVPDSVKDSPRAFDDLPQDQAEGNTFVHNVAAMR